LRQAWGYDYLGESRTVDVHVASLREKLKEAAIEIQSVRGLGYKLVANDASAGEQANERQERRGAAAPREPSEAMR
jgi:DNA-binding winged helix-turn-helix (wHTH) protein